MCLPVVVPWSTPGSCPGSAASLGGLASVSDFLAPCAQTTIEPGSIMPVMVDWGTGRGVIRLEGVWAWAGRLGRFCAIAGLIEGSWGDG
jgi:hypothetical protein